MKARLSISTAVAALALVAPAAALAGSSPDDRALPRGTTWSQATSPDDRAVSRGTTFSGPVVTKTIVVSPDDRAFARSNPSVARPTLILASGHGFDWTDASVGAASGFGIALVILGAGLAFTRRGHSRPVAA
jgi:hypothetical protein